MNVLPAILLLLLLLPATLWASSLADETDLMLIGQQQPVATAADRQAEEPLTTPALVRIVERGTIERNAYRTLAELLADQPGFYTVSAGRGSVPYLRGLRDSVLFLYDGVPLTTDVTKTFASLDREISLAAVDRVEIVYGPGSILWGPDAFAGVVNIVSRQAAAISAGSAELQLESGNRCQNGASLLLAHRAGPLALSLTASGSRQLFHSDRYSALGSPPTDSHIDADRYRELSGSLQLGQNFSLSGRWSDFDRYYSLTDADDSLSWSGTKQAPVRHLKARYSLGQGASHYSLTAYLQQTDYRLRDADIERRQRNNILHTELMWDRRLFSRALLSLGASYRQNRVDDALVRDGFLPEFLRPQYDLFVPDIDQADFTNRLVSLFGQVRAQLGRTQLWAGLRFDDPAAYDHSLSYSLGFYRPLPAGFSLKGGFATAYRSPYARELYNASAIDPEAIRTTSLQLAWQHAAGHQAQLSLFYSRISDHRGEDPYGGLSLPASSELYGGEAEIRLTLPSRWQFDAALALHSGLADETYQVLDYAYLRPDGSSVAVYNRWSQPISQGPRWLARAGLRYRPWADHSLSLQGRLGGHSPYSYAQGQNHGHYSTPLILSLAYVCPGPLPNDQLRLRIDNLLDRDYRQPDLYGPVDGEPFTLSLFWQIRL
ncbi:MAG: TonB-dependent receptor plug domain-containing protein [Desulfuromonas thiophila]|nr:TonB-dependent receptor plug domain-containing protein [Desulfuromonas thiophila]